MAIKNKSQKEPVAKNRLFGMGVLFCGLAVFVTRGISLNYNGIKQDLSVPIEGPYFEWANTMHVFFTLFVVGLIILGAKQHFRFFPIIGTRRKKEMSEKQWALRNKVFERSYFLLVLAIVLTVLMVSDWHNFILIKEGDAFTNGDRIYPLWTTFLLFVGLPSIVASGHQDS